MDRAVLSWMVLAPWLAVVLGCGGPQRGAVTGLVTLDGQLVENGTISFVPASSAANAPAWVQIEKGKYAIAASSGPVVGVSKVEIRWQRKTGKKIRGIAPAAPPDALFEEVVEAVPARYNVQSELRAEVKTGSNTFDFVLKSK